MSLEQNMKAVETAIKDSQNEDEINKALQGLTCLTIAMLKGINGKKFVKGFLNSAIKDDLVIQLKEAPKH